MNVSVMVGVPARGVTLTPQPGSQSGWEGDRVLAQGYYSAGMEDASASGLTCQFGTLEVSDSPRTMGEPSDDLDYLTATAREADPETESSSYFSAVEVEEQIEQSKVHWSLLPESPASNEGEEEEVAEVSNARVFKALRAHPVWGRFYSRQDHFAEFVVGEKFAAGAQAELYHVQVMGRNPEWNEENRREGREWVLKVFRKGTFLRDLQLQVPDGYLDHRAQLRKMDPATLLVRFQSEVVSGILLEDGRFAFLMEKEHFDLRYVIERNMKSNNSKGRGPFSVVQVELIMYGIALGMDWLHGHNIVHRDLKASNVLVKEFKSASKYVCYVADYECSVGVIGTGFFRAPEILQACKDKKLMERREVFSKAADVYAYGMTCYEVLTGKLPFEEYRKNDYDHVLNGVHPLVPEYVEGWIWELLKGCWQFNPRNRLSFGEILDLLLANSRDVRTEDEHIKTQWGENYRTWNHNRIVVL
jgi:serine/threonine protein kinase